MRCLAGHLKQGTECTTGAMYNRIKSVSVQAHSGSCFQENPKIRTLSCSDGTTQPERMFIITMPFAQASVNVFPPHRNISRGDAASEKWLSASLLCLSTTHSSLHTPSSMFALSSLCKVSFVCSNLKPIHGCSFFGGGASLKKVCIWFPFTESLYLQV